MGIDSKTAGHRAVFFVQQTSYLVGGYWLLTGNYCCNLQGSSEGSSGSVWITCGAYGTIENAGPVKEQMP
jgi:hypothetical protein